MNDINITAAEDNNGDVIITAAEGRPVQIRPGIYTVAYPNGDHRTLRVRAWKQLDGKTSTVVGFLSGCDNENDYTYFGFLGPLKTVRFWRKFSAGQTPERLARILTAVRTIAGDPKNRRSGIRDAIIAVLPVQSDVDRPGFHSQRNRARNARPKIEPQRRRRGG